MSYLLTNSGHIINGINYQIYVLQPSGISVTLLESNSPLISGDIVVRTLTDTNEGLPHTLEHLIFLGSASYQKGFLDLAANQCIARGTNAWTSQDSTVYSVTCGSAEGFLKFLPIFLDHVLFPLLTEEAFYTEVYHVTEDGDDAGVVYCEMQTYENTDDCLADKALAASIFPPNHVYSVETGGLLRELRKITVDDCRRYHSDNYTAENINVIITGNVSIDEVTNALNCIINKLPSHPQPPKPLSISNLVPMSDASGVYKEVDLYFPSQTYSDPGIVKVGILAASLSDGMKLLAEEIIMEYLVSSPVSPLYSELVHSTSPLCSGISFERLFYPQTVIVLSFTGTVDDRYPEIRDKISAVFGSSVLNITRIRNLLYQKLTKTSFELESNNFDRIHSILTYHHLYQKLFSESLLGSLEFNNMFSNLLSKDNSFWQSVLYSLYCSIRSIIRAKPSPKVMNELEVECEKRKQTLLSSSLDMQNLNIKLAKALAINNETVDYKSILEIGIVSPSHPGSLTYKKHLPGVFFHAIKSSFLTISVIKDAHQLTPFEKSCLPLIAKMFGDLPIGEIYSRTELNSFMEKYFSYHSLDMRGLYGEQIVYAFTFEEKEIVACLDLIGHLINSNTVVPKIVEDAIEMLLLDLSTRERCGYETMVSMVDELTFPKSTAAMSSINNQRTVLKNAKNDIPTFCTSIQNLLEKLSTSPCCVHVSGVPTEGSVRRVVDKFPITDKLTFTHLHSYSTIVGDKISIVEVPGEETSYISLLLLHSTDDMTFRLQMRVFSAWFGQLDGVIGREIRGKGLGYHFFTKYYSHEGYIMLQIQMSNDIMRAYRVTRDIIFRIVSPGQDILDEDQINLAKSSVIYGLVSEVGTPHKAVNEQIKEIHCPRSALAHDRKLEVLYKISLVDIVKLCSTYIVKLFELEKVHKIVVTCPPGKVSLSDFEI